MAISGNCEYLTEFRNGNLVFDVIDSGPRDGETVVLLHGFPQTASSWAAVSHILNRRGLRTVAPHQRGYSTRARPRGCLNYLIVFSLVEALTMFTGIVYHTLH